MMYDGTGKANSWTRSTGPLAQPLAFILSSRSATVSFMYGCILVTWSSPKKGSTMLLR